MYIQGLIPLNSTELAEAIPIAYYLKQTTDLQEATNEAF